MHIFSLSAFPWWALCLSALVLVSMALTRLTIRIAPAVGLMDIPEARRIHQLPIPRAGGVSVFASVLIGVGLLELVAPGFCSGLDLHWCGHLLAAALLLVVIGVKDDRSGISAWIKLGAQAGAGVIMYYSNATSVGSVFGHPIPWQADLLVHVGWTVVLINGFNLIDGMDGLCAGLAVISISILGALSAAAGQTEHALLCGIVIAALLGFMRYNFHPARIFLGDTGSMLVGFFIASIGTVAAGRQTAAAAVLLPLLIGGVPLLDVSLAIWRRLARRLAVSKPGIAGVKIFGPDRDHLHHRILNWGFSQRQAAFLIYGLAIALSAIGILPIIGGANWISISVVSMIVTALVGMRYLAPIEFIASGDGLRALIRRPRSSRLTAFAYYLFDVAVLVVAAAGAYHLVAKVTLEPVVRSELLKSTMIFVGSGIIALRFARAQQRRWSRASIHDFSETAVWLLCGVGVSFGLHGYTKADFSFHDALTHLSGAAIAATLIFIPRSIGFFLQESVIDTMHRKRRMRGKRSSKTTLIYGAGDLGELFVSHLRLSPPDVWKDEHFVGFIDDSDCLSGRRMRGFPIYGTLDRLASTVKRTGANSVLVTMDTLPEERMDQLLAFAEQLDLEVRHWNPALDPATLRKPAYHRDGRVLRSRERKVVLAPPPAPLPA